MQSGRGEEGPGLPKASLVGPQGLAQSPWEGMGLGEGVAGRCGLESCRLPRVMGGRLWANGFSEAGGLGLVRVSRPGTAFSNATRWVGQMASL